MVKKRTFAYIGLLMTILYVLTFTPFLVSAQSLDDLAGGQTNNQQTIQSETNNNYSDESSKAVTDYLKGYNPITEDQMKTAQTYTSPIVNLLGVLSGILVTITSAAIFTVTALDLLYIGVPAVRPMLDGGKSAAQGGAAGGMSPMGGGMGMGGMGMRGGMMGGGMMGGQPQAAAAPTGRCFVSDEAINCIMLAQQSAAPAAAPMGGGMGMGMGMPQQPAPQPVQTKSVIVTYLKKRAFFLVVFTIATVVLMSSIFTDCGLNLAQLGMNILNRFNGSLSNIQI